MREVVIVQAARTPLGKRKGQMAAAHSIDMLGAVQQAVIDRAGIDAKEVGQVVGGCVGQVGMQTMNVARNAWLAKGLPIETPATTVDTQCGSSQQATNLAYALVASGVVDVAMGCGVEAMTQIPMGSTIPKEPSVGAPVNKNYWAHHEFTSQFEGAERIAKKYGITREDTDAFGKRSQDLAKAAWEAGAFDSQIVPFEAPIGFDENGKPTEETELVTRDGGLRDTTLEGLAQLKTNTPDGVHTAGSSSQITDGAGAVLLMTRERAQELGATPMATIVDTCLVGCDPVLMLEGPIPATQKLLADTGLSMSDIGVCEINEAFASVVLAWAKELQPDMDTVNPNGGAIALGHPLGGTGSILLTKAVHELERSGKEHALVSMCCGGGIGTGTIIRRG
ncbi:MAG: steroid 3-ketoacyl-CoA thiolase [bacterium]|nr:steroid 3-ketoacyl-CoA thiolase [bacterium]